MSLCVKQERSAKVLRHFTKTLSSRVYTQQRRNLKVEPLEVLTA